MTYFKNSKSVSKPKNLELKRLTWEQIEQIDEILFSLGQYGEVHLIVERGLLKYINKVESYRAWEDEEQQ